MEGIGCGVSSEGWGRGIVGRGYYVCRGYGANDGVACGAGICKALLYTRGERWDPVGVKCCPEYSL